MNEHAASAANREEHALQTLLRAIAARDQRTTSRLLAEAPSLARMAVRVGALRDDERTYYLEARDPQLRVNNKPRLYDCFSATAHALPTEIPPIRLLHTSEKSASCAC